MILMQYLIMMGMFFAMPLFLSIVLGLSAFDTGVRMLPLSLALVIAAPAVPRLFPHVGPRRIVNVGLLLMLAAALILAARFQDGADASITTLPFILMGIGMGALASQLGNVTVSAVSVERGGEAGGLQYTAQNLGASLGTALSARRDRRVWNSAPRQHPERSRGQRRGQAAGGGHVVGERAVRVRRATRERARDRRRCRRPNSRRSSPTTPTHVSRRFNAA